MEVSRGTEAWPSIPQIPLPEAQTLPKADWNPQRPVPVLLDCGDLALPYCEGGSGGKESTCNTGGPVFHPWVGKFPWRREWQTTPVFLPGKSHGRRSLVGYSPCGHKPWWAQSTTEWLTLYFYCQTGEWRDFCFRLDDSGYILARVAHLSLYLKPGVPAYLFFYGLLWASSSQNDITGTQRSPLRHSQLTLSHCKCRKACASLEGRISMSSFSSHLL